MTLWNLHCVHCHKKGCWCGGIRRQLDIRQGGWCMERFNRAASPFHLDRHADLQSLRCDLQSISISTVLLRIWTELSLLSSVDDDSVSVHRETQGPREDPLGIFTCS